MKKKMIGILSENELRGIEALSDMDFYEHMERWFGQPIDSEVDDRELLTVQYMEDYERYRQSNSEEELQELIETM